jgi:uncharacterized protein YciI
VPHHVLFYDYVEDMTERRGPYRQAHLDRIRAARDQGRIVMAGALGDPPHGGAIVFRDVEPDQIEAFAREDPYMKAGLIGDWRIERWNLV